MAIAAQTPSGQPILILKEGTTREVGRSALRINIEVAKTIAESLKTSLGPMGMDKMLVDSLGDIVITSDGATMLKEMDVEHPAAKMMVEVAKAQDDETGDGTTSVVVLAGELLKVAEELVDQEIHPTVIIEGYKKAARKAAEIIDSLAIEVKEGDVETLKKVAETALASKDVAGSRKELAELIVQAADIVKTKQNGKVKVDIDNIKVEKKEGKSIAETQLIRGMVIDKEVVHSDMPKKVENARIALIQNPLEIEKTEIDAKIRISNPEQMKAFLDQEVELLREMVDKIKEAKANVVFCQKGIDEVAQHFLAKADILAVRRVKKSDMGKLAKATGARIITNIEELSEGDLGYAGLVEERKVGEDKMVFVENCKNPKAVTILIRGAAKHVVEEAERSIHDAIAVVRNVMEDRKVVPGGGAVEIEVSRKLREYAETLGGREQFAVKAFADVVEVIPKVLITNAGFDQIDKIAELRAAHKQGNLTTGFEVNTGEIKDMIKEGVIEPTRVKKQAIASATEAAEMILRIDDVIAAGKMEKGKGAGAQPLPQSYPGGAPPY